jgi:hypothetical protein
MFLRETRTWEWETERDVQGDSSDFLRVNGRFMARGGTYNEPYERPESPKAEECGPHHEHDEKL